MEQTTEPQSGASQASLFERLKSYPFNTDSEFANGLSIILGHPDVPASETEINRNDDLVLQAKCFYFSRYATSRIILIRDWHSVLTRKEDLSPPLDFAAFKVWLAQGAGAVQSSHPSVQPGEPSMLSNPTRTSAQEPTYPSSFAHIVELITTGQPIPGIQQIPDTVLTGHDTSSEQPKRLKPWEKERDKSSETVWSERGNLDDDVLSTNFNLFELKTSAQAKAVPFFFFFFSFLSFYWVISGR